jgi:hypothetical protein
MRALGFGEPKANRQSEGLGQSPEAKRNQSLPLRQTNLVGTLARGQGDKGNEARRDKNLEYVYTTGNELLSIINKMRN